MVFQGLKLIIMDISRIGCWRKNRHKAGEKRNGQVSQSYFEGSQLLIWLCLKVGVEEWHGLREKESQRSEKHTILGKQHLWSGISLNIRNSQICLFRPIPCHSTLDPLAGARTESSLGPSEAFCTSSLFCFLDGRSPPSEGISRSRRQSLALVWSLCHSRWW